MFPGHLRSDSLTRASASNVLLRLYGHHEPFADSCLVMQTVWRDHMPQGVTLDPLWEWETRNRLVPKFAETWNLHRIPQALESNFRIVAQAIVRAGSLRAGRIVLPFDNLGWGGSMPDGVGIRFGNLTWMWGLVRNETLAQFRDRIAKDLGRPVRGLPTDVMAALEELPQQAERAGWLLGDARTRGPLHVSWLFKRLCPREGTVLGYAAIAAADDVDPNTVRKAVTGIATFMDIPCRPCLQADLRGPRTSSTKTPDCPWCPLQRSL